MRTFHVKKIRRRMKSMRRGGQGDGKKIETDRRKMRIKENRKRDTKNVENGGKILIRKRKRESMTIKMKGEKEEEDNERGKKVER